MEKKQHLKHPQIFSFHHCLDLLANDRDRAPKETYDPEWNSFTNQSNGKFNSNLGAMEVIDNSLILPRQGVNSWINRSWHL